MKYVSKFLKVTLFFLCCCLICFNTFAETKKIDAELKAKFQTGVEAINNKDYTKAHKIFVEILEVDPNSAGPLFNAAYTAQMLGNSTLAIELYEKLIQKYPKDWEAMQRLIVLLNIENKIKQRDQYREQLTALWKSNTVEELSKRSLYLLDKIETQDELVYVMNFFELEGELAVRYKFNIFKPKDTFSGNNPNKVISLGSYKSTNDISRSLGDLDLKDRLFHLDGYYPDGKHETYGFFINEPSYDEIKKAVLKILSGDSNPVSSYDSEQKTITIDAPN